MSRCDLSFDPPPLCFHFEGLPNLFPSVSIVSILFSFFFIFLFCFFSSLFLFVFLFFLFKGERERERGGKVSAINLEGQACNKPRVR